MNPREIPEDYKYPLRKELEVKEPPMQSLTKDGEVTKRSFSSGATSTKQIRLSLIPHQGLLNAALRFELGLEKHGPSAYNALSETNSCLLDREWLIERCSHAIEHLYTMIDNLKNTNIKISACQNDAGAVAWCGLVLGEAAYQPKDSRSEDANK